MNQQDYEKLKGIIQAANPEIMELKFGCEVELPGKVTTFFVHDHILFGDVEPRFTDHLGIRPLKSEIKKILGRKITLADVLLAMQGKTRMEKTVLMMDLPGTFAYSDAQNHIIMRWNLHEDDLNKQSQECKEFLFSLLNK